MRQTVSILELNENYQKGGWRNRCMILGANGPLMLSVPLERGKNKKKVNSISIYYGDDWIVQHLRSIRSAYGTSAYFEFYFPYVESILTNRFRSLHELNLAIFEWLSRAGIIKEIQMSDSYIHPDEFEGIDLRGKKSHLELEQTPYVQVFSEKFGFISDLSILDLLFNMGPETPAILDSCKFKITS